MERKSPKKSGQGSARPLDGKGAGSGDNGVPGHRHGETVIRLAVMLSSYVGCSLRQVPKALEVVSLVLGADLGQPVSHVTVKDWLEKCGLAVYDRSLKRHTAEEAYALIVDNSISLGGQDLHVQLSAPATHPGHALRHSDVSVERIAVCQGWSKADTERELNATVECRGRLPEYAVNDNGRVLCPVFDEIGIPDHRDISHSFALCLEKAYAPSRDFREFIAKKGYARKFSHTKWAYLMPPKRPEFARFMNVFATVDWAKRVLDNDFRLSPDESAMLSFVKRNAGGRTPRGDDRLRAHAQAVQDRRPLPADRAAVQELHLQELHGFNQKGKATWPGPAGLLRP